MRMQMPCAAVLGAALQAGFHGPAPHGRIAMLQVYRAADQGHTAKFALPCRTL